ncbi:CPBP family intramembrane glutamic endopeptidase [Clostridium sardiniense]|uniref:CPBP family intramembrane glutamic endopeptidase n=1 Tax=Clostridium sardiniense TaxID=29369 RepID=UPI003D32D949
MRNTEFFKFENKNDDFPFYNGKPFYLTAIQSLFLLIIPILSIIIFDYMGELIPSFISPFINIIIPLGIFIIFTKSSWTKLFRKIKLKDIKLIVIVLIVNYFVTMLVAILMTKITSVGLNPAVDIIKGNTQFENVVFFAKTIPMLFGEELITIIPFLVVLQLATKTFKLSRKKGIILAWIITALIFGAIHLPTYNWNIIQAILGISVVRLVLTYPYIKTKNLWISFFVHVLNDWILLLPVLLAK